MVARAMTAACARRRAVLFMVLLLPFEWTTRSGAMASAPFDKLKGGADAPSTSSGARAERRMSIDHCPWFRPLRLRGAAHPGDLWTPCSGMSRGGGHANHTDQYINTQGLPRKRYRAAKR